MGDGYMCGRNVKMKESLSHFCGISFLPKWDFFFCGLHTAKEYNHHHYCHLLILTISCRIYHLPAEKQSQNLLPANNSR